MKDLIQAPAGRLVHTDQGKQQFVQSFLEDWPRPQECLESEDPTSMDVKKWRLQILLAVNPHGIPSLEYGRAYERMFGRKFDLREFGCDNLNELTHKMPEIFGVQEPDDVTSILFPDYPNDRVLHDARLGLNFSRPDLDAQDLMMVAPTSRVQALAAGAGAGDFNDLIARAWMDRDEDFPPDVVLAGESYEHLLKVSSANIPGSKGLYQAAIISAANPDCIFIHLKSKDEDAARIRGLSDEIGQYFQKSSYSIDAYNVPREFMLPGFPCILYTSKQRAWQRCIIVGRSRNDGKIFVELIDSGGIYSVYQIYLYLIPRQFLELPRQTLQVSIMGLKPVGNNDTWTKRSGSRLRCFSFENYWLDVLLLEPPSGPLEKSLDQEMGMMSISGSGDESPPQTPSHTSAGSEDVVEPVRRRCRSRMAYEALIVDRNDRDMDLYVDEVLVLETYAQQDASRAEEVATFKRQIAEALVNFPRPKNPFESQDQDDGDKRDK